MPNYEIREIPKSKTVYHVDYSAFESLVQRVYGHSFEVPSDLESSNDTSHEFNGMRKQEKYTTPAFRMGEHDKQRLQKFVETGKGEWLTRLLLQDLIDHDVLPEGDYTIRVSW